MSESDHAENLFSQPAVNDDSECGEVERNCANEEDIYTCHCIPVGGKILCEEYFGRIKLGMNHQLNHGGEVFEEGIVARAYVDNQLQNSSNHEVKNKKNGCLRLDPLYLVGVPSENDNGLHQLGEDKL